MEESKDPLLSLVADDALSIDRARIAEFLRPLVSIDKKSMQLTFRSTFHSIDDNRRKIEVVLAGALARSLVFPDVSPSLLPKEIIAMQVMPAGSVKTALRTLIKSGSIKKDSAGAYHIPMYRLDELFSESV